MSQQRPYFDKDTTKFSHELCQILYEVAHCSPALGCLWQLGSDVVCPVGSLGGSELALGLIPEAGPDPFSFKLLGVWVLWRSAKLWPHYLNLFVFKGSAVVSIEVDLVPEESLRLASEPFLEKGEMYTEVGAFVVGFPTVVIDEGVSADDAHTNLCAELDLGFCLASYNRTHMRLMYAHYAVLAGMGALTVHLLLLVIHVDDGLKGSLLCPGETTICVIVNAYEVYGRQYVTVKKRKHLIKCAVYELCAFVFTFDGREIFLADPLSFGLRPAHSFDAGDLCDQAVNVFGSVRHKVDVCGIADLGICTGCVRLEVAGLGGCGLFPIAVAVFIFRLLLLRLARSEGELESELVDVLDGDAFADGDKQRGVEYGRVCVFGKAAHILHVWVLLNGENGFLVRKVELMLDDECADDKPCRLVGCSDAVVLQTFVVDLLVFRPWQRIAHLDPPVCFREAFERPLHFFEGQLAVVGCDFHVGWSSFNVKVSDFLLNIQIFMVLISLKINKINIFQ